MEKANLLKLTALREFYSPRLARLGYSKGDPVPVAILQMIGLEWSAPQTHRGE